MDAFGVSTEAGVGDIQKLHKSMMDAIRGLQSEDVAARARRLDLDDPRRTPACQAGLSKTANTLFNNAPTQRKRFKTREEFQTAALRSRGAPLRALQGSYRKDIKPPGQAATDSVDAEGNEPQGARAPLPQHHRGLALPLAPRRRDPTPRRLQGPTRLVQGTFL